MSGSARSVMVIVVGNLLNCLKIELVSYPTQADGLVNMDVRERERERGEIIGDRPSDNFLLLLLLKLILFLL